MREPRVISYLVTSLLVHFPMRDQVPPQSVVAQAWGWLQSVLGIAHKHRVEVGVIADSAGQTTTQLVRQGKYRFIL